MRTTSQEVIDLIGESVEEARGVALFGQPQATLSRDALLCILVHYEKAYRKVAEQLRQTDDKLWCKELTEAHNQNRGWLRRLLWPLT